MSDTRRKARELVDKFRPLVDSEIDGETCLVFSLEQQTLNAKKCALITVDAILLNIMSTIIYHPTSPMLPINKQYWEQVKSHLI